MKKRYQKFYNSIAHGLIVLTILPSILTPINVLAIEGDTPEPPVYSYEYQTPTYEYEYPTPYETPYATPSEAPYETPYASPYPTPAYESPYSYEYQTPVSEPQATSHSFSGRVFNHSNGQGVDGVSVLLVADDRSNPSHGRSTSTGSDGGFGFSGVNSGGFNVEFRRGGFEGIDSHMGITSDTTLDIGMTPLASTPPSGNPNNNLPPAENTTPQVSVSGPSSYNVQSSGHATLTWNVSVVNGTHNTHARLMRFRDDHAGTEPTTSNGGTLSSSGKLEYAPGESGSFSFSLNTSEFNCGRVQVDGSMIDDQTGADMLFIGMVVNYGVDCAANPYQTPYVTPYATPYATPYPTPAYATPSYPTPYSTPYATPYSTPYATPYPTPVTDVCPNIDGIQAGVPSGYELEGGNCVLIDNPPTNSCPLPDTLGDNTAQTIGASFGNEKSLQTILTEKGYSLNAATDQKQYQEWNVSANNEVEVNSKFLDSITAHQQVFGYYKNGQINTFTPIFKTADISGYESIPIGINGPFTIHTSTASTIGFAIKSFSGNTDTGTFATTNSLSTGNGDQALTYNVEANKYIVAFEDLTNGDFDYQDLVVEVRLNCGTINNQNNAPIANAGPDQVITLPTNTAALDGSGSTDSDGTIVSYVWTFVSGPSDINPADVISPSVSGLIQGSYIFKLTVTDNDGATGEDTVTITVNPAGNNGNPKQCEDNVDNADPEDTLADELDPGCHTDGNVNNPNSYNPNDDDETDVVLPECSDGVDNADPEDTLADTLDGGCHTDGNPANPASYDPNDNSEVNAECSDTVDNADPEDTLADTEDPGCHTDGDAGNPQTYDPGDNNETNTNGGGGSNPKQCEDNVDNSDPEDTLADESDAGCHTDADVNNPNSYNPNDDDETNTQCSDGIDNDGDGKIDFPNDPGCSSLADDDETNQPQDEDDHGGSGGGGGRRINRGQVLGAEDTCGIYVEKYLRVGYQNNVEAVKKVQTFLNDYMNAGLVVDGIYGVLTESAVRNFQLTRDTNVLKPWGINHSTGIFYLTTQTEVNNIMCPPLDLEPPQPLVNWSLNYNVETPPIGPVNYGL